MKPYEIGEEVYYICFNDYNVPVKICKGKITDISCKIWYGFENSDGRRVHINYVFRDYDKIKELYNWMRSETE